MATVDVEQSTGELELDHPDLAAFPVEAAENMLTRELYSFSFKGYSVWLELQANNKDLEEAVASAAFDKSLWKILEPHCTVLYGVEMEEEEARKRFLERVVPTIKEWPELKPQGCNFGVCFDGVDGEEIDMSWIELALHSSPEHEELVDKVYSCFYDPDDPAGLRAGPWKPHVSIAYDNPIDTALDEMYMEKIFSNYPSLLSTKMRKPISISLWRTEGKLWDWECLEKVTLN